MNFLPKNEDGTEYEVPASAGNYMRFEQGDNKFRVLSSAIVGWVGWVKEEGKPVPKRFRMDEKPIDLTQFEKQKINHFWAFVIWNYQIEKVQILEITQKGIMKTIKTYTEDEDRGDPKEYDIVINREGEDLNTKYGVSVKPKKELSSEAKQEYEETKVELEALFEGKDPFGEKEEDDLPY